MLKALSEFSDCWSNRPTVKISGTRFNMPSLIVLGLRFERATRAQQSAEIGDRGAAMDDGRTDACACSQTHVGANTDGVGALIR